LDGCGDGMDYHDGHAHLVRLWRMMIEPLSPRELEVLCLMAQGLTNRQIAARMLLSYNTVRTHVATIYDKMQVHSKIEAVVKAYAWGLITQPAMEAYVNG
jgi:DNA-binding NarL/FixJ family response regulator